MLPRGSVIDLYLRYSSDGQSIESQEQALRQWAQEHGLIIRHVFRDAARSGSSVAGRDDFLRMFDTYIQHSAHPRPVGVVLWSFARFAREIEDAEYYKWAIRHAGYIVWSLIDQIPEGEYAPLFETLQHIADSKFLKRLREETTRGLRYRVSQKFASGGFPPIGYRPGPPIEIGLKERRRNGHIETEKRYGSKWEFDPATHDRVKQAWTMRLQGRSYLEIHQATHIYASAKSLGDFFERVTYAGALKFGADIVWDAHPAYVTRAEWEQVQAMHKPRAASAAAGKPKQRRTQTTYLFSGFLRCGICGWAMSGNKVDGVPSYRCDWRHRQGHTQARCDQPSIVAHALHRPLLTWLANDVLTFERMVAARERLNALLSGERRDLVDRKAFLEAERKRLQGAIARLLDAIERGGYVQEIQERLEARQGELRETRVELAEIEAQIGAGQIGISNEALRVIADEMQATLEEAATEGDAPLRTVVQGIIKKAELSHDTLRLSYSPLPFIFALEDTTSVKSKVAALASPTLSRANQEKYLGMVGAPNGNLTTPKYSFDFAQYPLDVATLEIQRPSSGRKAYTHISQSGFLQDLLTAVEAGCHSARLYADLRGIPIARASERFRVARKRGLIIAVGHPGTHAGGVIYRVANPEERNA